MTIVSKPGISRMVSSRPNSLGRIFNSSTRKFVDTVMKIDMARPKPNMAITSQAIGGTSRPFSIRSMRTSGTGR